jgi:hypothetical protein
MPRRQPADPHLPPPGEQQTGIYIMPRGDLTDGGARLIGFSDDAKLLFDRPTPALAPIPSEGRYDCRLAPSSLPVGYGQVKGS